MSNPQVDQINVSGKQMFSQALWFFLHSLFAIATWGVLMGVITLFHAGLATSYGSPSSACIGIAA